MIMRHVADEKRQHCLAYSYFVQYMYMYIYIYVQLLSHQFLLFFKSATVNVGVHCTV